MSLKSVVNTAYTTLMSGGVSSAIFNMFQGRCTFFACVFTTAGIYGWLHGKDLTSFALLVGAIQSLLVIHSWKEDIMERLDVIKQSWKKGGQQ